jgi:hypothetical protein
MRQQPLRQFVEPAHLLPTLGLTPDFGITEVPRVTLEQSDFVQPLGVFEQAVQGGFGCRVNVIIHDTCKTPLLLHQSTANYVLHGAVSRSSDVLLRQVMHQFPENIDRLAAYRRRLEGSRL